MYSKSVDSWVVSLPLPLAKSLCHALLQILKAVSHKGEPIKNFFFYSLGDNVGLVESLGEVV